MIQARTAEVLDIWLEASTNSGIVDLQNFAFGIQQDYRAARAALETEWSGAPRAMAKPKDRSIAVPRRD